MKVLKKIQEFTITSSQDSYSSPPGTAAYTLSPVRPPPAVFCVVGCMPDTVLSFIRRDLEIILEEQVLERHVSQEDFQRLNKGDLETVLAKARSLGVSLELGSAEWEGRVDNAQAVTRGRAKVGAQPGIGGPSGSRGLGFYVLRGLKEDVLSVNEMISEALKGALKEILREKDEAQVAYDVQWSMKSLNGCWVEFSLQANYLMEKAHLDKGGCVDVEGPHRTHVTVNLGKLEATDWNTGLIHRVRRKQTPALPLPNNWEPMGEETFKKVNLQPNSAEYQTIAQGFKRTANQYTILKIERVQNLYLWQAFAVCRQRILAKNGPTEVGEKMLYHGTGAEACNHIEKSKFDRGFAGENGSLYGKGVYFAVNAVYSAKKFSPEDSEGLKRLYVARVLTGRYTVGTESMKAPPPRSASDPTDCFDSLVNNQQKPTMYVIFHDDQAYPEYLVTFK